MGYEVNIENAIKVWLTENTDVIKGAVAEGAVQAVSAQAPDGLMRLGAAVAVVVEKWLESNKTDLIAAMAGQIATYYHQLYDGRNGNDIQNVAQAKGGEGNPEAGREIGDSQGAGTDSVETMLG